MRTTRAGHLLVLLLLAAAVVVGGPQVLAHMHSLGPSCRWQQYHSLTDRHIQGLSIVPARLLYLY